MRAGLVLSAFSVAFAALPAVAADPTDPIFKVERDFATFTHDHGYTKGFFTYFRARCHRLRAPGAQGPRRTGRRGCRGPERKGRAVKVALAPLYRRNRRFPGSGLGQGPWTIDGSDTAGWFMTIWQKQDDGLGDGYSMAVPAAIPLKDSPPMGSRLSSAMA
ncbi:MAG: hypothetical protein WDN06_19875 [Asticcacaulis sp.]